MCVIVEDKRIAFCASIYCTAACFVCVRALHFGGGGEVIWLSDPAENFTNE